MTLQDSLVSPTVPGPTEPFDIGASDDSLERLRRYSAEYGDFFRVYSPRRRAQTYVVNNPDGVKRILLGNHRNYTKGIGTDQISILLGRGIMTSDGEFWRRQRRMLQPAFHRRVLEGFGRTIAAVNEKYAERWGTLAARGESVNVTEAVSELTLAINLQTLFGTDLELIQERFGGNPFSVVHTEGDRDLRFAYRIRSLARLVRELIAHRRAHGEGPQCDFLAMALAAQDKDTGERMSDKELVDEVLTLVVAGYETTAAALTWAWYWLGRHPRVQRELSESARALPADRVPGIQELESWTLGQQVIKETLRLCPPGWIISRRSIDPDVLLGVPLPAGADVFISPYFLHRHPDHWTDPERFDPTRFNEAADAARHRFAYIPFGAGPRHCIGETLAMYEIALHLATMSRRFRLVPLDTNPPQIEARINYRLRSDLRMRVVHI